MPRIIAWLAGLSLMVANASASPRLYFFTENYPPYNMPIGEAPYAHNEDGIDGLCTRLVKAMLQKVDYDYLIKLRDWTYAFNWVQRKANHGLFCAARTEEREDKFQWVGPLAAMHWTLFAAPGSDIELNSLEDAKGMRIGGYKDDVITNYLLKRGYNVSIIDSNQALNAEKLRLGQIDLWAIDGLVGTRIAKQEAKIDNLRSVLVFRETPLYLAMNNDTDPSIVTSLQQALDQIRAEGQVTRIRAHYGL